MLLSISCEKQEITKEIKLIDRIRYKLSNQMRHFKEFNQFKIVLKLIDRHLTELQMVEQYNVKTLDSLNMEPYMLANTRIKNHIVRKGQQVKQLMHDAVFLPYATLAMGCLARINHNLNKIEKKMQAIVRIIQDVQKRSKSLGRPKEGEKIQ